MTNQLVAEAEALPDIDEFYGLSVRDIANAIVLAAPDSEDEARAIAAIRARAPGLGHNRPPLAEALDADLEPLRATAAELVKAAGEVVIIPGDHVSAGKAHDVRQKLRAFETRLEDMRKLRGRPHLEATHLINAKYGEVCRPVQLALGGETGKAGIVGMLTRFDDEERARADAAKRTALEELRRREAEAEDARIAAEEAAAAGKGSVKAELEAAEKADAAERAALRAEAIRPEPIRSHLGQVTRRREIAFNIVDLRLALGWLIRQKGLRNHVEQSVRTILGRYFRGLGVDAAESANIPGVTVTIELGAATSRR